MGSCCGRRQQPMVLPPLPLPPVQPLPPPPPPPPITIPVYFPQLTPVPVNGPAPQMVPPQPLPVQQQAGFQLPPLQPFHPTNVPPAGYPFQLPQQPFQLPRIY